MCGIAGFVGRGNAGDIRSMTAAMRHRGPDGEGFIADLDSGVHLGHRRLAVLDIAGGAQPMWNEDDSVAVIHNGEIYNHSELRDVLTSRGHRFRSDHSDTEVLVHGYEEWGGDLLPRLNGMFAFAVFDRGAQKLFLARDRFGEKPLFYSYRAGLLVFASDLCALCRHSEVKRQLRPAAVQKFLAYGFLPGEHTLLEDMWKLPGGCHLTYDIRRESLQVGRYWRFSLAPDDGLDEAKEGALTEELRALLFQAVRRRLAADVPVGLFLSGGLDSSAVLAGAAAALPSDQIRTFTIGFGESSFDESEYAALVAKTFGTHHAVERIDLGVARQEIPAVLGVMDEPIGDPSILPTALLSRFTRREVTVALSGDGGDELFAGYDPFDALVPARIYQALVPRAVHPAIRWLAARVPFSERNMSWDFKIRRGLAGLSYPAAMWNPAWLSPVEPAMMRELCEEPLDAEELYVEAVDAWDRTRELDVIDRTLEFYTTFYLPDNILAKVDRASMMSSLESRAAFLDNDLVAFCQRLPNRFKYHRGQRKYLLKRALSGVLPREIIERPKKGFGIPLAKWLRSVPAEPPMEPLPGVRMGVVRRAWEQHRKGAADHRLFLWSWLSLQASVRRYLGRSDCETRG
ncbi:MAG TPA: asparagine synthase (glutamine-hydrolyzing) [Methylomirabilota bacterium]|nr:asparagine synthase (glutamine-hydrolyzing) [Methylomirabilota bacterium]